MNIKRSHHWTDEPINNSRRRRIISNWANYKEDGEWNASAPGASQAQAIPRNWTGAFDFSHTSEKAPLQCFFRDAMDAGNRAMVGVRISEKPGSWLNLKALDCTSADAIVEDGGASVRWSSLWAQTDLVFKPARHKLIKELHLTAPGHPLVFEFSIRLAAGHTLEFLNGGARVLDKDGLEVLRLPPPWAHDSATTALSPNGHQSIGVTMTEGNERRIGGNAYKTIRLEVNGDDLASAVYPVIVDPTVTISGTSAIEDAGLFKVVPTYNTGAYTQVNVDYRANSVHGLMRILPSAIPAGTITAATMKVYARTASSGTNAPITMYRVSPANTWVEGTTVNGVEAGTCCWNYARNDTQAWAGSVGCATPDTDYVAADSQAIVIPANNTVWAWYSRLLNVAWFAAWAGGAANNGWILIPGDLAVAYIASTEDATNPLYFELDYEAAAAAGNPLLFFKMI